MADPIDDHHLHMLRQQVLSTQKKKSTGRSSREQYRSAYKDRKPSPIRPGEVIDSYPRLKSEKRGRTSKTQGSAAKRSKRVTSSSRSSYSSYSHSGSMSGSPSRSYSSSRSSESRSRSRASSRSSSYSNSESGSYSRSSVSGSVSSNRSRSPSPISRNKKSRLQEKSRQSAYQAGREILDKQRGRKMFDDGTSRKSAQQTQRRNRGNPHGPREEEDSFYIVERTHSGERRSRHGLSAPLTDGYFHENEPRRKSPGSSTKHLNPRPSNYMEENNMYGKSSRNRPSRVNRGNSPNSSFHRPSGRSPVPNRHNQRDRDQRSPARERRVVRNFLPTSLSMPPAAASRSESRRYQSPTRQQRWPGGSSSHTVPREASSRGFRKQTGSYSPDRPQNRSRDMKMRATQRGGNLSDKRPREEPRADRSRPIEGRNRLGEREGHHGGGAVARHEKESRRTNTGSRRAEGRGRLGEIATRRPEGVNRHVDRDRDRDSQHADSVGRHLEGRSRRVESNRRHSEGGHHPVEVESRHAEGNSRSEGGNRYLEERIKQDGTSMRESRRSRRDEVDGRSSRKDRKSNGVSQRRRSPSPESSDVERHHSSTKKRRHDRPLSEDKQIKESGRENRRERKRRRREDVMPPQSSSELAVLDSVSPQKERPDVEEQPEVKEGVPKTADKEDKHIKEAEQDLLGEYEFNPFVDVDVELDYDENMEEPSTVENSQEEQIKNEEVEVEEEVEQIEEEAGQEEEEEMEEVEEEAVEVEDETRLECEEISHEDISSDSSEEADSKEKTAAISSPIRVTPERDLDRKNGSSSKWHKDKRRSTSGTSNKLSVKERLFVSRKTIEEKKHALGRKSMDALRPSLANRLGPSPGARRRAGVGGGKRFSGGGDRAANNDRPSKGSAFEIAEAYKKKKMEEGKLLMHSREQLKTKKLSHRANSSQSSSRKLSPLQGRDTEKERALDKRIDKIKQRNRDLEKRQREIERDEQQLYG